MAEYTYPRPTKVLALLQADGVKRNLIVFWESHTAEESFVWVKVAEDIDPDFTNDIMIAQQAEIVAEIEEVEGATVLPQKRVSNLSIV